MRIALIAPPWLPIPPPAYGGLEAVVDTLARGLHDAGHEVVLATTGDSTCPVAKVSLYERARTEAIGNVFVEVRNVLHAYDATAGVDLTHDHTVAGPALSARFGDRCVVTTNHGPFTDDAIGLYRWTAPRVPIIAISHHHASSAGDLPIGRVIHHGIETARYPVGDGTGGYAMFLGRMSPDKGVREAIHIARNAGVPLVIAAKLHEPLERDYFATEIEPLLGPDVRFVGEVGGADKYELLGGAVALVNPLRWDEPFGLAMVEALACGTPVVATPRGAVPEIVDDGVTGFLRSGVAELASGLRHAGDLDRAACRAAVDERFSMDRMVAEHVTFYQDVLDHWPVPSSRRWEPPRSDRPVPAGVR